MAKLKVKSNIRKQARRLSKFSSAEGAILTALRWRVLVRSYIPVFAEATPKKTEASANSIEVDSVYDSSNISALMKWGTDYIKAVNEEENKSQGFADKQFKSIESRLQHQAINEVGNAYVKAGKKNKLNVKRTR